jgi:signal peptidase I
VTDDIRLDDINHATDDDAFGAPVPAHRSTGGSGFIRWFAELLVMIGLAFLLALVVRTYVVQPYVVPTSSMVPTIEIQDRVIANKFIYRFGDPEPGDVIVLDDPGNNVPTLIKRVIAVGGQTIELVDGKVVVDGVALEEPYTYGKPSEPQVQTYPYAVPEGSVWVMGDNRTDSLDSRSFGAVPLDSVRGKAVWRYWPLNRLGTL